MMLSPRKTAELGKSRNRIVALIAGLVLGFGISTIDASAQTYACPPGYYFLAGYGCYPFGGYANNPPPPSYYYYPAYPYAVPAPPPAYYYPAYPYGAPSGGVIFEFGGRDHDRGRDHGHR